MASFDAKPCGSPEPQKTCGRRNLNRSRASSAPRQQPSTDHIGTEGGGLELGDEPEVEVGTLNEAIVPG